MFGYYAVSRYIALVPDTALNNNLTLCSLKKKTYIYTHTHTHTLSLHEIMFDKNIYGSQGTL